MPQWFASAVDAGSHSDNFAARGPIFFILIPALIGFVMGVNQVAIARAMAWPVSIIFWVGLSLLLWAALYLVTFAMSHILAPWRSAPIWIILLAALAGSVVLRPLIWAYVSVFTSVLDIPTAVRPMKPFALDVDFITEHFRNWAALMATWIVANLVSLRFVGYPNYRSTQQELAAQPNAVAPPETPSAAVMAMADVRSVLLGGRMFDAEAIAAVQAEDHYVRVYAPDGSNFIITARFRDAVDALKQVKGCQTHRSWWVNLAHVARVDHSRRDPALLLSNGITVPVGHSYKQLLRAAGVLPTL
jgi:LytTr DNA-binding domain